MAYRSLRAGRLHVVRWGTPELADVDRIAYEVSLAFQEVGRPLLCVAVISADADPPSDEVRAAMSRNMPRLLAVTEHLHFVVEGQGFRHSVMRSVLTGFILFGKERGRLSVHDDLQHLLGRLAWALDRRPEGLVAELRKAGILLDLAKAG